MRASSLAVVSRVVLLLCLSTVPARAATFIVNSTGDGNVGAGNSGTFRYCLNQSEAAAGADVISFSGLGAGSHQIDITSALPSINQALTIDGTTAVSYVNAPRIVLHKNAAANFDGLAIYGDNVQILGLVVSGFVGDKYGIAIYGTADNVVVEGCYLGTDLAGTAAVPNSVGLYSGGTNVRIGGTSATQRNVVSGNSTAGVILAQAATLEGNYIGLGSDGATIVANGLGIFIHPTAPGSQIGGTTAGAGNVISGNNNYGVEVVGANTRLEGNLIGTDATGVLDRGNAKSGLRLGASGCVVGGPTVNHRNVIAANGTAVANDHDGITVDLNNAVIQGNYIGVNLAGAALRNEAVGIRLVSSSGNTIGGSAAGEGNLISGHNAAGAAGIRIAGGSSNNNVILGNRIGTDPAGLNAVPNHWGIYLAGGTNNTIGGAAAGAGNLISGNADDGMQILSSGNFVYGNRFGTTAAGTAALANGKSGLALWGGGNNTIGGPNAGEANVFSGNHDYGLWGGIAGCDNNVIRGNYVGTDPTGTLDVGNGNNGIRFDAGSANTIGGPAAGQRNIISGNGNVGVYLRTAAVTGTVVQGNYIGTDVNGTATISNRHGIYLYDSSSNTIGGGAAGEGNLIAGNRFNGDTDGIGIWLTGATASNNNLIRGNKVGTDVTGNTAMPNFRGVVIERGSNNTIGGTTAAEGNLISGNLHDGLQLINAATTGTLVQRNYFGTNAAGTAAVPNLSGIALLGSSNNFIGTAGDGNVSSGNSVYGVYLGLAGAVTSDNNQFHGNYIGTDPTGMLDVGNGNNGLRCDAGAANVIGGPNVGEANVISGNGNVAVYLRTNATTTTVVRGNKLGTNAAGTAAIANRYGVYIYDSHANTIGGVNAGEGNLISGNQFSNGGNPDGLGIWITGATASNNNVIVGNKIGTDVTGAAAIPNYKGISIDRGTGNRVGGPDGNDGNLIAGSVNDGLQLWTPSVSGTIVQRNTFGTNAAGTAAIPNLSDIAIFGSSGNTIGGAGAGNLLSGSGFYGLYIGVDGGSNQADNTLIQGNRIGTNTAGDAEIPNHHEGIYLFAGNSTTIGGGGAGEGNLISGNDGYGIVLHQGSVTNTIIRGNTIGTNLAGAAAIPNGNGVLIQQASGTTVGGGTAGEGNLISGNDGNGILISGATAANNRIQGNTIGPDATGAVALSPGGSGIWIRTGAHDNTVGGTTAGERNLISGNGFAGISVRGDGGTTQNLITGNYIGTNAAGTGAVPNSQWGVLVEQGATNNTIGGNSAATRNLISGNLDYAVLVQGAGTSGNLIAGNYIGTDVTGASPLSNPRPGVAVMTGANNNTIGGPTSADGNLIAFNAGAGVTVDAGTSGVLIRSNRMHDNGALGIDLDAAGVTLNDPTHGTTGGNRRHPFPVLTTATLGGGMLTITGYARAGDSIDLFVAAPDGTGFGEGNILLGNRVEGTGDDTDGGTLSYAGLISGLDQGSDTGARRFRFTVPAPAFVTAGTPLTATASSAANDTSEFSGLLEVAGAPTHLAFVTQPSNALAGVNLAPAVVVEIRDAQGNRVASANSVLLAVNTPGGSTLNGTTTVPADDGRATFGAVNLTQAQTYTLATVSDNLPPAASASFTIAPAAASPGNALGTVPATGKTGVATSISVTARDAFGNPVPSGGGTVAASVSGANSATVALSDQGNGTYLGSYTPMIVGTDTVAVTFNAVAVVGSPFTTQVSAGNASAAQTTATVPGGIAGMTTTITVQARDAFNNPLPTSGGPLDVHVSGANNAIGAVTDHGNGTYTVTYTPTHVGTDQIAIALAGTTIGGSPYSSQVVAGPVGPLQSTAVVPNGVSGVATVAQIQARDGNGNPRTTGGDTVAMTVSGANSATGTVTDNGNGTYTAWYVPTLAGTDQVAITLTGVPVMGSPFASQVVAAGPTAQSTATVPNGVAGQPTTVMVTARDFYGNPIGAGGATVTAVISGSNSASPAVTDLGNGTYRASYTPLVAGTDQVALTINGLPLTGSAFPSQVVAGASSAAQSTATVPHGTAYLPTTIQIALRDAQGNPRTTGGDSLVVLISGANTASPAVTDQGNGSYTAAYTPTAAGTDQVAITLGGLALGGSPYPSQVAAATPDAGQSTVTIAPAAIAADGVDAATLEVTLRTAAGQPVIGLLPAARSAAASGAATDGSSVTFTDGGQPTDANGRYSLTARTMVLDQYQLQLTAGGVNLAPVGLQAVQSVTLNLPAGVSHVSVPANLLDPRPEAVFGATGWQVARWDRATQTFAYRRPGDPADPLFDLLPGRGRWVKLDQPFAAQRLGLQTPNAPFDLPIATGWNEAGNPYNGDLPWDIDAIHVFQNGADLGPLSQTSLWNLVKPYVWVYDRLSGEQQLVFGGLPGTLSQIPRLEAFYALADADNLALRLVPPVSGGRSAPAQPGPRDWSVQLEARSGDEAGRVTIGVSSRLQRGLDIELPPQLGDGSPLLSLLSPTGGRLAANLRSPGDEGSWELLATSRQAGPVTLSWPSLLRQLPRGVILTLTDRETGRAVLLNTAASYRYEAAGAGDQRRLVLTARQGNLGRSTITSLTTEPSRGRGLILNLVLTGPAEVRLTVRGPSGRLVKQVELGTAPAGAVAARWDGTDANGRAVPAGTYLVEASAISPNGAQSRVTRVVAIR